MNNQLKHLYSVMCCPWIRGAWYNTTW